MAAGHVRTYALFKSKDLKCAGHLKTQLVVIEVQWNIPDAFS